MSEERIIQTENENQTDQVRKLWNNFSFSGYLLEVEKIKEGVTQTSGKEYVYFKAKLQFGESPVEVLTFSSTVYKMTYDNKINKNYDNIINLIDPNRAKVNNPNPVRIIVKGRIEPKPYVTEDGTLSEGVTYNVYQVEQYKEEPNAAASDVILLEANVSNIAKETRGEFQEETGRLRITLVSTFKGKPVVWKKLIVSEKDASAFEYGGAYGVGTSTIFKIKLIPHIGETKKIEGGFGEARIVEGKSYLETVVVGADPPYEEGSPRFIAPETVKILLSEYESTLREIEEKGYQGNKTVSSTSSNSVTGFSSATKSTNIDSPLSQVAEEEIPF